MGAIKANMSLITSEVTGQEAPKIPPVTFPSVAALHLKCSANARDIQSILPFVASLSAQASAPFSNEK
ncbi:hypothetical protein KIN20_006457 [Parelaphostrongylus tenuis]|uniref:Uncharacterized protein n=1 Tax=Parelaphostrongylus tenuis TaxID=148309 RepID=A0AAD5M1T4_PARTN|nr:hypothetical protein KIN20_006457 [Parelaphostrongylus tenuis]